MLRVLGRMLVICAALVLAASFAGDMHGLGDSLAIFRPLILLGSLVVAALAWRWRLAQLFAVLVIGIAGWHVSGMIPYDRPSDTANFRIYQKNMLFRERDRARLVADIRASDADVVTLQEVSRVNVAMIESLRDLYPHQLLCNAHSVGAVAILSQTPLEREDCGAHYGFAQAVTLVRGRMVQVVSVHLHWPFPYGQQDHARRMIADLAPLEGGETVIGGDFNMVASGRAVAWFEDATQTARVGTLVRTYDLFGYPLGIDHVLATGGIGALSVRPKLGSDHYGLLAQIELP